MRVLHVASDVGTYGAERFVSLLLDRLRAHDLDLGVLTVRGTRPDAIPQGVARFDARRAGKFDVAFFARMVAAIAAFDPDIVHTHTAFGKYYGGLAALLARAPVLVHTEHNSEFGAPGVLRPFTPALVGRMDAVVAFSRTHRERLIAEEGVARDRIVIIPNGVELRDEPPNRALAREVLGGRDDEPLLVLVGRLAAVKNQRLALEALALLPGMRLVLIGDGPDRAALEAHALAVGVAARTTFLGYRDDAAALVGGADVALVTSHNEAMPLAVIEAMLAWIPIVSTPWAGVADLLGAGAYGTIVADESPAAFARAIRRVLDDPLAARARAAGAQRLAHAEYAIETTASRYADLYRTIVPRTRSANARMIAARS